MPFSFNARGMLKPTRAAAGHQEAAPDGHITRTDAKNDASDDAREPVPVSSAAPPILTVEELAALLRLDHKTVYAMVNRGEIPGVRRFGRTLRIHRDTVLQWMANGQGQAPRPRRRP